MVYPQVRQSGCLKRPALRRKPQLEAREFIHVYFTKYQMNRGRVMGKIWKKQSHSAMIRKCIITARRLWSALLLRTAGLQRNRQRQLAPISAAV